MNLEKKDVVEFVGAVAILASLVFVGVQLQQSQNIAAAEGFAAFLYQNPGARKVWDNRESSVIKYRTLLSDGGTYSPSWTNRVRARLVILDREKPLLENKPFVDW